MTATEQLITEDKKETIYISLFEPDG